MYFILLIVRNGSFGGLWVDYMVGGYARILTADWNGHCSNCGAGSCLMAMSIAPLRHVVLIMRKIGPRHSLQVAESGELRRKGEWCLQRELGNFEKERPVDGNKLLQIREVRGLLCPKDGTNKRTDHADGWNGLE